jgi:hypothetical protein
MSEIHSSESGMWCYLVAETCGIAQCVGADNSRGIV